MKSTINTIETSGETTLHMTKVHRTVLSKAVMMCNKNNNNGNNNNNNVFFNNNNNNGLYIGDTRLTLRKDKSNNNNNNNNNRWSVKTHRWIPVILLVLVSMTQAGSTGSCDSLVMKFTPYPCQQIKRSPQDLTINCTVYNKPYCERYAEKIQPKEFPDSDLKLSYINIYDYIFKRYKNKNGVYPTLNLSISLPKGEALFHSNAIRLDIWSNHSNLSYKYPGICRLLEFSAVHFKPDTKLALLNHHCFWIPETKLNIYVLKISLYPSNQHIIYTIKIADNQNTVLAVGSIFPSGTLHALMGITPPKRNLPKRFILTNLDTFINTTRYTTDNSVMFTKLRSGKYQITVYSGDNFMPKEGFQFPVIHFRRHPETASAAAAAAAGMEFAGRVILIVAFLLLLVMMMIVLLRYLCRKHIICVDLKTHCHVLLVTFHQNCYDQQVTYLLKMILENNFKWSVEYLDLNTSPSLLDLNLCSASLKSTILYIIPAQWNGNEDSREMATKYFFNDLLEKPFCSAVIYQRSTADIPKCLENISRFHIIRDIQKIFEFVYKANQQLNGNNRCFSLHRFSLSPIYKQQFYKYPNWVHLKGLILSGSDSLGEHKLTLFESKPL